MKVLHYIGTTVPGTGIDTFVLQLVAAQQRIGVDPLLAFDETGRTELVASSDALGIPHWHFPTGGRVSARLPQKARTAHDLALRTTALVGHLRRARVDVLHVHSIAISNLEAHLAGAIARVPIVVTHHATLEWFRPMWSRQSDAIFWLEKRRAFRVVAPYREAADELIAHGVPADRVRVVPFCADEERFSGSITPPQRGGTLELLFVSRLVPGKGHSELLEALHELRPRLPHVRLRIAGDGPTRDAIAADVARLALGDVVTLAGRVPHSDVPALMRRSHVVVLPSTMPGETFPVCLLEGMCLGMPCIGTRWFGIPDIIVDGETGVVVEPHDRRGLARAIERLATDPAFFERASAAAARRAREHFTASAVARQYRALYDEALVS